VFEVLDLPLERREVCHVGEGLLEKAGGADDYRCLLLEEVVEASLARDERAFHNVSYGFSEATCPALGERIILAVNRISPFSLFFLPA
jgi:hypothetical protein